MKKILGLIVLILLVISFVSAFSLSNSIEFKGESKWVYNKDIGFITKDAHKILEQQDFTERSRAFFWNELKNKQNLK